MNRGLLPLNPSIRYEWIEMGGHSALTDEAVSPQL